MEKKLINPWKWQDERNYVQALEVTNVTGTLYVSGQTAIDDRGVSSRAEMREQLQLSLSNLEKVVSQAGYKLSDIVRLNIYAVSCAELSKISIFFKIGLLKMK